ncbi:MAG TPA: response regulator transcription factor [Phycisphaerae bacterium]|nr:response regulator transcription factor [Phycisphaerae bacterium]HRY69738.1 response regulator transcription factor [Phycisphaerae bacterium]HSA29378.1 response regulator transcription factor [Phycisphaerae bacterium]
MNGEEHILIIEDDAALLRGLKDNFEQHHWRVSTATDGEQGLIAALDTKPALIVLDIMLPRINGYEVCRRLREKGLDVPIIMLTAKGQESDIVLGLNLGADDYVTKPFSVRELLARANAFLRRRRHKDASIHDFGPYRLDLTSHRLLRGAAEVVLTPKEFRLLTHLVRHAGRAFTRNELLNAVWGDDVFVTRRSVDRCVTTLRGKIEADPRRPEFIQTVRDIGYRFEIPDDEQVQIDR